MENTKKIHEPLFHLSKHDGLPMWKNFLFRLGAVLIGLLIAAIMVTVSSEEDEVGFFNFFASLFSGVLNAGSTGQFRNFWLTLQDTALLLGVALALVPAFKMKFWNLGGNGQILMGCLMTTVVLKYLGGVAPDFIVWVLMFVAGVLGGAIWALIPAIFKSFFKTNESLFTLMMNYIALNLIAYTISCWYPSGTGAMSPLANGVFPEFSSTQMGRSLPVILVIAVVTVIMSVYLKYSKHGYEISVVGDSENTARYASINVQKVMLRTIFLSGALCGLVGVLLSGSINHMVSTGMDGNMGFTAILVAWLSKFNPLIMAGTSFFINFMDKGMSQVCEDFGFTDKVLAEIAIGIIYFLLIACEFFSTYKVILNNSVKAKLTKVFNKKSAQESETNKEDKD